MTAAEPRTDHACQEIAGARVLAARDLTPEARAAIEQLVDAGRARFLADGSGEPVTAPARRRHRCRGYKTGQASRLEVLNVVLEQPLSMARGKYSTAQLLALGVEADELRERLAAEGRCAGCGVVVDLVLGGSSS